MKDIRDALDLFWNGFVNIQTNQPIPAWQNLRVPQNAPFPRIIYEIVTSPSRRNTLLSARIFDRRVTPGFIGVTDGVMEQAEERIPESGVVIETGTGTMTLYRATPFCQYMPADSDDPNAVQGIIRYEIRFRNRKNL